MCKVGVVVESLLFMVLMMGEKQKSATGKAVAGGESHTVAGITLVHFHAGRCGDQTHTLAPI
jgi:hypothetical protein